jgi:precorrin-6Y C5,15-methyltransferase (decarboxylating)
VEKTPVTNKVKVIGIKGCQVPGNLPDLLRGCRAVCSSKRLIQAASQEIGMISPAPALIPITPLSDMVQALCEHLEKGDCAILASGDPLFFGIGKRLLSMFDRERIEFHPSLSAVQIACARFKIPWSDAQVISLHGRRDEPVCARILSSGKTIIFTDAKNSPDTVAAELIKVLERAGATRFLSSIRVHVAEDLDCPGEKLSSLGLKETASRNFSPLNIMIVEIHGDLLPSRGTGLSENEIAHLRGLITKDEVRAITLHRLRLEPGNVFWDVGAGSGSVSLEAARMYPDITSYAVESEMEQQEIIRENIKRFKLFNVIPVEGRAPGILETLPRPHRVFIGGSGGRLKRIIELCAESLAPGGVMVANAILEETCRDAPTIMEEAGLFVDVSRITVTRVRGAKMPETRLNTITVIRGIKKGADS